jgi:phosphopantetheinyl transferase
MAIYYVKPVEGPAELGVWKITEQASDLLQQIRLSDTERKLYEGFRTDLRRKQWLAYRRMIKEIISPQKHPVHYDGSGKPFLAGSKWHISVSHTGEYAGVIISPDVKVGIDMELVRPRIDKVKEKFLSDAELASISREKWLEELTLAWCAKEALYKLYGWRNLDFKKNINILLKGYERDSTFYGEISLPSGSHKYKLFWEMHGELLIVWAIENVADPFSGRTPSP